MTDRERIDLLVKAVGSLSWLLNNAHNHDTPLWAELEAAAMADVRRAMQAVYRP